MQIHRFTEPVATFLERPIPSGLSEAEAWFFEAPGPVLVMGSAQDVALAEAAPGMDVARRRSGGGAVFVDPARSLWLDVIVPPTDPRWSDDVRTSSHWLGRAWAEALRSIGIEGEVYDEGLEKTPWGRLVCFGANGPGEVLIAGRKTVGIAQRRTRDGARFQCIVYDRWDPHDVVDHLVLTEVERAAISADLAEVAGGVGDRLGELRDAITRRLLVD
ncbi:hypothetical protein Back2_21630 [Nocardioides baekrokdamisoli]|uniref:BPL/LPL catalytic domain-containing protein n=1 Tax=Nocardioides baekrokdamisoli TaxID=1804624 RepID=A0A3G9IHP7_9ACTN|nr:lipoate--protein ligase family protein [Nocardioides baekrokdamisoli]BBH17876.1 hypothetical protein Back2_21630 [Nocardioides baekrokdamisoli]